MLVQKMCITILNHSSILLFYDFLPTRRPIRSFTFENAQLLEQTINEIVKQDQGQVSSSDIMQMISDCERTLEAWGFSLVGNFSSRKGSCMTGQFENVNFSPIILPTTLIKLMKHIYSYWNRRSVSGDRELSLIGYPREIEIQDFLIDKHLNNGVKILLLSSKI